MIGDNCAKCQQKNRNNHTRNPSSRVTCKYLLFSLLIQNTPPHTKNTILYSHRIRQGLGILPFLFGQKMFKGVRILSESLMFRQNLKLLVLFVIKTHLQLSDKNCKLLPLFSVRDSEKKTYWNRQFNLCCIFSRLLLYTCSSVLIYSLEKRKTKTKLVIQDNYIKRAAYGASIPPPQHPTFFSTH